MAKELYSLTTLTAYLNERFQVKKSGEPFTTGDVQQYISRGYIPKYLGNIRIKKDPGYPTNIYSLVEEKDELGK